MVSADLARRGFATFDDRPTARILPEAATQNGWRGTRFHAAAGDQARATSMHATLSRELPLGGVRRHCAAAAIARAFAVVVPVRAAARRVSVARQPTAAYICLPTDPGASPVDDARR